jgi:hypothetical protein
MIGWIFSYDNMTDRDTAQYNLYADIISIDVSQTAIPNIDS